MEKEEKMMEEQLKCDFCVCKDCDDKAFCNVYNGKGKVCTICERCNEKESSGFDECPFD